MNSNILMTAEELIAHLERMGHDNLTPEVIDCIERLTTLL
jgi:hypothetical protein